MSSGRDAHISPVWRDSIFSNKVLFCTGGAGTICSGQVRAFVLLGGDACIIGRNTEKTEKAAKEIAALRPGAKVLGIGSVDVRKPEDLQDAASRCVKELGGLDFCIAGAAGNFLASVDNLSTNAFKSVMDIDVLGSYNTLKATIPHLIASAKKYKTQGPSTSTGGRLIFVSATLHYTGTPLQAHVSAAKAAIDALSSSVCIEYGPLGVTSNVIAPGPIGGTEGMERLSAGGPEARKKGMKQVPIGRWGEVREIADATVYLFSGAGDFVNGDVLVVDGGAWRTSQIGGPLEYPDFLLSGEVVQGVAGMKKSKI
ncbi:MAG: hypothetical protein M1828_001971 [Chrysothrix sp. TS-e1954]|nr:MAG: hypothetical protein M1828_001971 [Chrysothrix sp. TS-e1954]